MRKVYSYLPGFTILWLSTALFLQAQNTLFNGKDLQGWRCEPVSSVSHWTVVDGKINGENPDKTGSMLWTDREYTDFELELEYKALSDDYDTGVYPRGEGHQVQIGISRSLQKDMTACIYAPRDGKGAYPGQTGKVKNFHRLGEWNHLRIIMKDRIIRTFLNGEPFVVYKCLTVNDRGPIGLQLHAGVHMAVEFRNLKVTSIEREDRFIDWDFNGWNDKMGWSISREVFGGVRGGSLWLCLQPDWRSVDLMDWEYMVWGRDPGYELSSPPGLKLDASRFNKVRLRILNQSPETDGWVYWRSLEDPDKLMGPVRFTIEPSSGVWQEVICHMDEHWSGRIDRLVIKPATMWFRGDLWIDEISVESGPDKLPAARPDLLSTGIVPQIDIPGLNQEGFLDAFRILDECLVTDVPMMGFPYPFLAPGGAYGSNWWQLDGSLNMAGAKWVNQELVENTVRGFFQVQDQNPDGRIDLWGGATIRGQAADVSSIPRYFEAAWDVARRTSNTFLQKEIYSSMKDYLGYWLSDVKRDPATGLVTAVFEESLGPDMREDPATKAAVDLNVAVAIGCRNAAMLAEHLGYSKEADHYNQLFTQLCRDIDKHLWNDERGAYMNYNVKEERFYSSLLCTTFDPLQLSGIAEERIDLLLEKLVEPDLFNWGSYPLTTVAKTEAAFRVLKGTYNDTAWMGGVWTMRNLPVIRGLEHVGRHDLAAELCWSTLNTFHNNFYEFVAPDAGSGEGVQRYGWTASQYIQCIIEHLFGIDYDAQDQRIRICPHIPVELNGKELSIRNLKIPPHENTRMDLILKKKKSGTLSVHVDIHGQIPDVDLQILVPGSPGGTLRVRDGQGGILETFKSVEGMKNLSGIVIPLQKKTELKMYLN